MPRALVLSAPPAAAPPPVQAAVQVGHLPLRGGEELLQLVLKGLVAGGGQRLLRPGGVTLEMLQRVVGAVTVDPAVLHKLADGAQAASPGMKYKHYAPKAKVILVKGDAERYREFVNSKKAPGVGALCFDEDRHLLKVPSVPYGSGNDSAAQARELFDALRELDERQEIQLVYARCPEPEGVGMAVYNRLIRAAGFEVITL